MRADVLVTTMDFFKGTRCQCCLFVHTGVLHLPFDFLKQSRCLIRNAFYLFDSLTTRMSSVASFFRLQHKSQKPFSPICRMRKKRMSDVKRWRWRGVAAREMEKDRDGKINIRAVVQTRWDCSRLISAAGWVCFPQGFWSGWISRNLSRACQGHVSLQVQTIYKTRFWL